MSQPLSDAELKTRALVGRLLALSAGKASASIDAFSGWLLAGLGVALAFLLANMDVVARFVFLQNIKIGAALFVLSAVPAVAQKFLAAIVSASASSAAAAAKLGDRQVEKGVELNPTILFRETERALLWPMRSFGKKT
ncbi:MAG: hypothetical protein ABI365_07655, partial [Lysobacteraceae bacterium]